VSKIQEFLPINKIFLVTDFNKMFNPTLYGILFSVCVFYVEMFWKKKMLFMSLYMLFVLF